MRPQFLNISSINFRTQIAVEGTERLPEVISKEYGIFVLKQADKHKVEDTDKPERYDEKDEKTPDGIATDPFDTHI